MTCINFFGSRPEKKLSPYPVQPKSDLDVGHHTGPSLQTFIRGSLGCPVRVPARGAQAGPDPFTTRFQL